MANDNLAELIRELELTEETSNELDKNQMQTTVYQTLKDFEDVEFPKELHGRIMRSIYLRQFKMPLTLINVILAANLSISLYRLWTTMNLNWSKLVAAMPQQSWGEQVFTSIQYAVASVPVGSAMVVAVNISLLAIGLYLFGRLRSMIMANRRPVTN
jgi:hypothetical protein